MDDALQILFVQVINVLLQAIAPVIGTLIIVLLRQGWLLLKSKLNDAQLATLQQFVALAVKAAEQIAEKTDLLQVAAEKKAWAINEVLRMLDNAGMSGVDVEVIATLIEAAIKDEVHKGGFSILEYATSEISE